MGNRGERHQACYFEGKTGFCSIAQGIQSCHQVVECIDANTQTEDLTPEQFCNILPITINQAVQLRERQLAAFPENNKPLSIFLETLGGILPFQDYREEFTRKVMEGILEEDVPLDFSNIKFIKPKGSKSNLPIAF